MLAAGFLTHHPDLRYRLWGLQSYQEGDFDKALKYFRRSSYYADKPSQGMVAEMLWNGQGVEQDRALAYAWMDLAAERGYAGFAGLRERYWKQLDEAERVRAIELGQEVYARFGDEAAKPRYEARLRWGYKEATGSHLGGFAGTPVQISVPGSGDDGGETIDSTKFYDERYWNPKKYWEYTDNLWMKARIGKVTVGDVEQANEASRIPAAAPDTEFTEPKIPDTPDDPAKTPGIILPGKSD
ncbi:Sel1 repeat protein HcpA [Pseudoxanthomonas kalamensis DSM 18571]|uniref:sel1 repeat family protein n=1 Tax=Pseudoxanthomonas kalamensis TaxID=289483 RepID=UPI001390CDB4|nr:sel1 repeat family protein [Pseudoxanthomonas kalamensis]KAF1712432.1 Sel1 repeat protein HcpA [Pseudoxanthomonas kalamensis DSM 18571]